MLIKEESLGGKGQRVEEVPWDLRVKNLQLYTQYVENKQIPHNYK